MNEKKLLEALAKCKTDKQTLKAIAASGYTIERNDTNEVGSFSVWLDSLTRVYKTHITKEYKLQHWQPVTIEYSGAPMFSSNPSYF